VITKKINKLIKKGAKKGYHWTWIVNGHFGRNISIDIPEKTTVIIPSYSVERVRYLEPQVRSILKCDFIEKIIISNHNPQILPEGWVKINDGRLKLINQPGVVVVMVGS
jgi:hypothetical protein